MVRKIEFGSREAANIVREKVDDYRASTDDKRTKTVKLDPDAPRKVQRRVENDAFASRGDDVEATADMGELSESERESLKRQHSGFTWQENGFEAMRVKASVQREGVSEWQDYYEPGEGVGSALSKIRDAKQGAQTSRASIGIGGERNDRGEQNNTARRARQTERAMSEQVKSAKGPAIVEQDADALEFIRDEQSFGADVFDVAFSGTDDFGRTTATGADVGLVRDRHEQRSERAQTADEQQHAEVTRDPAKWTQNPAKYDFPGVDTLDPVKRHAGRSERAQEKDENERAPLADSPRQWANDTDQYDLPGVDTPQAALSGATPTPEGPKTGTQDDGGNNASESPLMSDDRAQQGTLGVADPTQHRESRQAVEQSDGGLFEDTRSSPDRGPDMGDAMAGRQEDMGDMLGMDDGDDGPDMSTFM